MGGFIFLVILGFVIYGVVSHLKDEVSRKVESAGAFLAGERGRCIDCKHCCKDDNFQYSRTGYFCRLSRCEDITESTVMDCKVKPSVTEDDLQELFKLKIWTPEGERYIRGELLGKKMTFDEVDAFLKKIPQEHPEFIRSDTAARYQSEYNNQ